MPNWHADPEAKKKCFFSSVASCNGDLNCLDNLGSSFNYCPNIMGVILAYDMISFMRSDGFNSEGDETPFGKCTANCQRFSDSIGIYDIRLSDDGEGDFL